MAICGKQSKRRHAGRRRGRVSDTTGAIGTYTANFRQGPNAFRPRAEYYIALVRMRRSPDVHRTESFLLTVTALLFPLR